MMRYLVLSDTHGLIRDAAMLIERWQSQIDGVWHLGDHAQDLSFLRNQYGYNSQGPALAFSAVCGNCDMGGEAAGGTPYSRSFTLEDRHIFMCHGHLQHVNYGLSYLKNAARDQGANVVLFGHTHIPLCLEEAGVLYLNPGSLTAPRGGHAPSFALLELEKGKAAATILDYSQFC